MTKNILSIEKMYHLAKAGLIILSTAIILLVMLYEANAIRAQNVIARHHIDCVAQLFTHSDRANLVIKNLDTCEVIVK